MPDASINHIRPDNRKQVIRPGLIPFPNPDNIQETKQVIINRSLPDRIYEKNPNRILQSVRCLLQTFSD
jgi:hypothetical protein